MVSCEKSINTTVCKSYYIKHLTLKALNDVASEGELITWHDHTTTMYIHTYWYLLIMNVLYIARI